MTRVRQKKTTQDISSRGQHVKHLTHLIFFPCHLFFWWLANLIKLNCNGKKAYDLVLLFQLSHTIPVSKINQYVEGSAR